MQHISSTRRRMAIRYCLPKASATFSLVSNLQIGLQNFQNFCCRKLSRKLSGNFPEILEILEELKILLIDTLYSSCKLLTSIENWLIL